NEFKSRKFAAGLFVSIVDLFLKLDTPALKAKSFDDVLNRFPRQDRLATGGKANTLVLRLKNGELITLRPFYNNIERVIRADNTHMQIEIDKVRTGSKRLQRVGDVDGWDGGRLAIRAEVKQFVLRTKDLDDLKAFANEVVRRGAIGVVVALGYEDGMREALET